DNAYPSLRRLLVMTETDFRDTFRGTPVTRAKRRGLARNAAVALGNVGDRDDVPFLIAVLVGHDEPLVRGNAAWALGRLGGRRARFALDARRLAEPDPTVRTEIECALAPYGEPYRDFQHRQIAVSAFFRGLRRLSVAALAPRLLRPAVDPPCRFQQSPQPGPLGVLDRPHFHVSQVLPGPLDQPIRVWQTRAPGE